LGIRTSPWLARYAVFTAFATLCLICLGGLVTSHNAGMAVPDWPNTYGYNMFLFPISKWVGGIFYEHTHRLLAATVGFLTLILAGWLWKKEERRWVRWLGVASVVSVILQGVLGGLRVVLFKQEIGIVHAALAQIFSILVTLIALFLSSFWFRLGEVKKAALHPFFRKAVFFTTLLIFLQLLLGAAMRHQHAGLAVPDFPLAYGKVWPPTDGAFVEEINQKRLDARDFNPITASQIYLHMVHRIGAIVILAAVTICFVLARKGESVAVVRKSTAAWLGLVLLQASLGAWTVWSNKAADVATAHVVVGALSLLTGALLYPITRRVGVRELKAVGQETPEFEHRAVTAHA
jgi:cytochrome c oxidase assembly protein subunit 15